ncbi:MAG: hypothetical protein LRY61_11135, partial [Burkholderiaceae bacterium]|nr:hypothetical protein [Burkholderiaceae bacterium]
SPTPRLGIITHGKSYLDTLQALDDLNISLTKASELGLRLYKVGLTWPLAADSAVAFANGLSKIMVVEEKTQPNRISIERNSLRQKRYASNYWKIG